MSDLRALLQDVASALDLASEDIHDADACGVIALRVHDYLNNETRAAASCSLGGHQGSGKRPEVSTAPANEGSTPSARDHFTDKDWEIAALLHDLAESAQTMKKPPPAWVALRQAANMWLDPEVRDDIDRARYAKESFGLLGRAIQTVDAMEAAACAVSPQAIEWRSEARGLLAKINGSLISIASTYPASRAPSICDATR